MCIVICFSKLHHKAFWGTKLDKFLKWILYYNLISDFYMKKCYNLITYDREVKTVRYSFFVW